MNHTLFLKFKGSRTYAQGGDIFSAVDSYLRGRNCFLAEITFRGFSANHLRIVSILPAGAHVISNGCAVDTHGQQHSFWLVDTGEAITDRYDFDEDSIVREMIIDEQTIRIKRMANYSIIEQVIALTKKLNYSLTPDIGGKWVLGQFKITKKLPDVADKISVRRKACVVNRFSINTVFVDDEIIGEIRFVVGQP